MGKLSLLFSRTSCFRSQSASMKARSLLLIPLLLVLVALVVNHRSTSCMCCGAHAYDSSGGIENAHGSGAPVATWQARHQLAIAYLSRKTHSTYGRDSMSNLERSLDLLHRNVLTGGTQADVLVLHEGDFTTADQVQLMAGRHDVHFIEMPGRFWRLPPFLNASDQQSWVDPVFSVGYRHMIHWFSLHIWNFMADAGYEWVMRLDEDSFIHSPIPYDLVGFMEDRRLQYGYRMHAHEARQYTIGFPQTVGAHLVMYPRDPAPTSLLGHCTPPTLEGVSLDWDHFVFYNNFFLTNISFWQRPDVRRFLEHIDRTGGIYTHRWGDALVHTAAVQIFMPEEQVHKFQDWTYEHATIGSDNVLMCGGIVAGTNDTEAGQHLAQFAAAHHGRFIHCVEESWC